MTRSSEADGVYVVYRALYGDRSLPGQTNGNVPEAVIVDGHSYPPFQLLAVP